ncbi:MAG: DUF2207 domain-containing protein [Alphaproteobacteria bacterium]|nr:DUF2207 domain-containing protein [Alphaproteobacteria bacterium]
MGYYYRSKTKKQSISGAVSPKLKGSLAYCNRMLFDALKEKKYLKIRPQKLLSPFQQKIEREQKQQLNALLGDSPKCPQDWWLLKNSIFKSLFTDILFALFFIFIFMEILFYYFPNNVLFSFLFSAKIQGPILLCLLILRIVLFVPQHTNNILKLKGSVLFKEEGEIPASFSPFQMGEIFYGSSQKPFYYLDAVLLWLVNNKYIQIYQPQQESVFFSKLKDFDNSDEKVSLFFNALFRNNLDMTSLSDLKKDKVFENTCQKLLAKATISIPVKKDKHKQRCKKILNMWICLIIMSYVYFNWSLINLVVGGMLIIVCLRKDKGYVIPENQMYKGKYGRFKRFLKNCAFYSNEQMIRGLIKSNPNYMYDVLPYLVIFSLWSKWEKQYLQFYQKNPIGYRGNGHFNEWFLPLLRQRGGLFNIKKHKWQFF